MKARNNKRGDNNLVFSDGHSINLSRGEETRELTEEEMSDPYFAKQLKHKWIVVVREKPQPKKEEPPKKEKEAEPEVVAMPEEPEKKEKPKSTRTKVMPKGGKKKSGSSQSDKD